MDKKLYLDKSYKDCCWLGSYNSVISKAEGWVYHYQTLTLEEQFNYGVRCFHLNIDWYPFKNKSELAITCEYKAKNTTVAKIREPQTLLWFLKKVKTWIKKVNDPITLIITSHTGLYGGAEILRLLVKLDMENSYLEIDDIKDGWPTISQLITKRKQLVIFSDNDNDGFLTSKHYNVNNMPHIFIYHQNISSNNETNKFEILQKLIMYNYKKFNTLPTYVLLDFVDEGDGLKIIDYINNL